MEIAKRLTRIMRDVVRDLRSDGADMASRAPAVVLSYSQHLRSFLDDDDVIGDAAEVS